MPESKGRGRPKARRVPDAPAKETPTSSPRWLVPAMVTSFVVGLLWIVMYYIAPDLPVIDRFGGWNMIVGFGFILVGFGLSTKWR